MTFKSETKATDKKQGKFNKVAGSRPKSFKDKKVGYANKEDTFVGKRKFKDSGDKKEEKGSENKEDQKNAPKGN